MSFISSGGSPFAFWRLDRSGFANDEIVEILEVFLSSVQRWRKKVENGVLASLAGKHGSGQFSELTKEQLAELKDILLKGALAAGDPVARWTSRIVADLIRKKWNVAYCRSNVRYMLNRLGLSYQKPAVKSTQHSQEV